MKPRTLILRSAGTNCERETAHAFSLAGADTDFLHINQLLANPKLADGFQLLALPGGFSYGDDIAAGKILANQIRHHLGDAFRDFIAAGKPIIGICNGFQVLVKTDLLPGPLGGQTGQTATLAHNTTGRYIDKWVHLSAPASKCIWTQGLPATLELPIAHGEGKFVPASPAIRSALLENGQIALVYVKPDGSPAAGQAPANPNGSTDDIAGVCDASGLVFGLMPHPERYVSPLQHFAWTRRATQAEHGEGLAFFKNAVEHATAGVGAGV